MSQSPLSGKRQALCSRANALRVASKICDATARKVCIIRTGHPLQPYRVSVTPSPGEHVEVELVV